MFPFFKVEVNTGREIKVDTLKKMLDIGADKLLRESSELLKTLAQFLVQYTLCICNKSDLKDKMASAQREAHQKNPEDERKNMFKCVLDFQTNIDVAFTWMQYVNHCEEWRYKKMNIATPDSDDDRVTPLFTGDMGGRKNGGSHLSKKGLDLYKTVIGFINDFRQNEAYGIFQRLCNMKAREYRILKTLKVPQDNDDDDDDANVRTRAPATATTIVEIPLFDVDENGAAVAV
jgi:hypothetical protein